jgi:hypothetical protein
MEMKTSIFSLSPIVPWSWLLLICSDQTWQRWRWHLAAPALRPSIELVISSKQQRVDLAPTQASSRGRYMATSGKQSGRTQGSLSPHQGLRRVRMARIGYINLTGSYNLWAEGSNLLSTVMPESTTCRQVPGSNARGRDSLTCMTSRFQHRAANMMHDRSVDMANRWRHSWAVMHQSFGRLQQRR